MTDTYVTYAPGEWTLVARSGRYLLVETSPTDSAVSRLWSALETPADSEAVPSALAVLDTELRDQAFCLVTVGSDSVHVAQRGLGALLDGRLIAADTTPVSVAVPPAGGMIIASSATGAGAFQIPIESGVVGAAAIIVIQVGDEPATSGTNPPSQNEPEPPMPADDAADADDAEPPLAGVAINRPITDDDLANLPAPVAGTGLNSVRAATGSSPGARLWDNVPVLEPEGDSPQHESLDAEVPEARTDETLPSVGLPAAGIDPLLELPPPSADPGVSGDETAPDGPTVLAGYCLNGHVTPAHAPGCRVCGDPLPPQTPRTIARPPLGALVLQDGTRIELDHGAVLGRAPRVPDEATEEPHLVNLAAYGRDVSRQHAEVIVQGWSVFIRDLGSANGTKVHAPGGETTDLEPGVSLPLLPGSTVEIAEVTRVEYQAASASDR